MNALIFAAGCGRRMRPLTGTCPKPVLRRAKSDTVHALLALDAAAFLVRPGQAFGRSMLATLMLFGQR